MGCLDSQRERLSRLVMWWMELEANHADLNIMGDLNLDWFKWSVPQYHLVSLVDQIKDFLAEAAMVQTVEGPTRFGTGVQGFSPSLIDHCYSNNSESFSSPIITHVGDSDHLGVYLHKWARKQVVRPRTVRKLLYKNFCPEPLLLSLQDNQVVEQVVAASSLEEAESFYLRELKYSADKAAPIKVI